MQRATQATNDTERQIRQVRFPGILTAAQALGVHRNHLYYVLSGKRKSVALLKRYNAWKKQQTTATQS